jgi:hypothetical protein
MSVQMRPSSSVRPASLPPGKTRLCTAARGGKRGKAGTLGKGLSVAVIACAALALPWLFPLAPAPDQAAAQPGTDPRPPVVKRTESSPGVVNYLDSVPVPVLGIKLPDVGSAEDPTSQASRAAVLTAPPPVRATPAPSVPVGLPDPLANPGPPVSSGPPELPALASPPPELMRRAPAGK